MSWDKLIGHTLPSGWKIVERREDKPGDSGGCFSVPFIVERGGDRAFMKAFDIARVLQETGADTERMAQILDSINFETKLLGMCRQAGTEYVTVPIDDGQLQFPYVNMGHPVRYLIFELAEQDARRYHNYRATVDALANLMILHHAAKGLQELHELEIAHQDLKPSNVLLFSDRSSRVADLGRSSHRGSHIWHDHLDFPGDPSYAPLEVLYNACDGDWHTRRLSGDLFMLGSFATFLFTSVNLTTQVMVKLQPQFWPMNWPDGYDQVVPYLRNAMREALNERPGLSGAIGTEMARIIRELSDPEPKRRGSPKIGILPARFSMRRYVSTFERMAAEVRVRGVAP